MIREAINIIKSDSIVKELINGSASDSHIYFLNTSYTGDCIVYESNIVSDDKIKALHLLKVIIIAESMETVSDIEDRLREQLLTFGDIPLTDNILKVEINGGGLLTDDGRNKIHRIINFEVLTRSVKHNGNN